MVQGRLQSLVRRASLEFAISFEWIMVGPEVCASFLDRPPQSKMQKSDVCSEVYEIGPFCPRAEAVNDL